MVQFAAVVFKPLQLIDFFYDLEEEKYHKWSVHFFFFLKKIINYKTSHLEVVCKNPQITVRKPLM